MLFRSAVHAERQTVCRAGADHAEAAVVIDVRRAERDAGEFSVEISLLVRQRRAAEERKGVGNFNVAVREWNEQIIFLRKIVPGGADKSYGIQVARLAGLPKEILDRAKEILSHLENPNGAAAQEKPKRKRSSKSMPQSEKPQLDLL